MNTGTHVCDSQGDRLDKCDQTVVPSLVTGCMADKLTNSRRSHLKWMSNVWMCVTGDSMSYHDNQSFTTYDLDNDPYGSNCAVVFKGAWWYRTCHESNLNALYKPNGVLNPDGMCWTATHSDYRSFTFSEMKIKPV